MSLADRYCPNCFREIPEGVPVCPHCNYKLIGRENLLALPVNAILKKRYVAGRILGAGGFGITYKGYDTGLHKICAIKEYVPLDNATRNRGELQLNPTNASRRDIFEYGKKKFLDEADTLKELKYIPEVVDIWDCFEENGTAYFVMEYLDGSNLNAICRHAGGRLPFEMAYGIILATCNSMEEIHSKGNVFHRDISPENIMITRDNQVRVIDFGTAKYIHGKKSQNLSVVLKPGYAPPEQYTSNGQQGAFTDVYALASTFYYIVTGRKIPPAPDRLGFQDQEADYTPLSGYPFLGPAFERMDQVLDRALKLKSSERTQTMRQFKREMEDARPQFLDTGGAEDLVRKRGTRSMASVGSGVDGSRPTDKIPTTKDENPETKKKTVPESEPKPPKKAAPKPAKKPYLLGLYGPVAGYLYPIPANAIVSVGRSPKSSNIIVPINVIGRKHVEVFYDNMENLFYVSDNYSVNQTSLDGVICPPGQIFAANPGSRISLAQGSCVFELNTMKPGMEKMFV